MVERQKIDLPIDYVVEADDPAAPESDRPSLVQNLEVNLNGWIAEESQQFSRRGRRRHGPVLVQNQDSVCENLSSQTYNLL
ncbi:MAG: hypothetical protein ABL866_10370 [Devosia sp.]